MNESDITEELSARLRQLTKRLAVNKDDEDTLIERGRLYWKLGMCKEAINDYLAANRINPEGKASQLLDASYRILDFYNKDLYNP